MARKLYGAGPGDYFADTSGVPVPNVSATVWTDRLGGQQVTDLLNSSGAPTAYCTADAFGQFRFYGPDNHTDELWVQSPGGLDRYRAAPVDGYAILLGGAAGARIWGGNTFPSSGDGAVDGDYLFYEG